MDLFEEFILNDGLYIVCLLVSGLWAASLGLFLGMFFGLLIVI
jgi:hypothetical protein